MLTTGVLVAAALLGRGRRARDLNHENAPGLAGQAERLGILDAFAGSGALGLEALSRGAATAVPVPGRTSSNPSLSN